MSAPFFPCVNETAGLAANGGAYNLTWDNCAYESATDATLDAKISGLAAALDITYYLVCGCLVFFMQLGFAMLEVGCVAEKNINNIILKGVLDICIAALFFWGCGFAVAFGGGEAGSFLGGEAYFFGDCLDGTCADFGHGYHEWFFQFAFAATASTIVSGAVAERTSTICYVIYAISLTAFVYPVVVHWQWGGGLTADAGAVDYAGSAVVHMTGGLAAVIGAAIIGPRSGRFASESTLLNVTVNEMPAYSVVFQTLGTLILWFGWYGFNTGSTLGISWVTAPGMDAPLSSEAGLIMINTTLGPAAAGVTAMLLAAVGSMLAGDGFIIKLQPVLNGLLAGLVSITAGCGDIRPGAALVMGIVGGVIYTATSHLQQQLKIDDVVDAGPVHFWCGMWGVVGLGLFADDTGTGLTGIAPAGEMGLFYGESELLTSQLYLVLMVIVWVGPMMALTFGGLKLAGLARVSAEVERKGLDISKHGLTDFKAIADNSSHGPSKTVPNPLTSGAKTAPLTALTAP